MFFGDKMWGFHKFSFAWFWIGNGITFHNDEESSLEAYVPNLPGSRRGGVFFSVFNKRNLP